MFSIRKIIPEQQKDPSDICGDLSDSRRRLADPNSKIPEGLQSTFSQSDALESSRNMRDHKSLEATMKLKKIGIFPRRETAVSEQAFMKRSREDSPKKECIEQKELPTRPRTSLERSTPYLKL